EEELEGIAALIQDPLGVQVRVAVGARLALVAAPLGRFGGDEQPAPRGQRLRRGDGRDAVGRVGQQAGGGRGQHAGDVGLGDAQVVVGRVEAHRGKHAAQRVPLVHGDDGEHVVVRRDVVQGSGLGGVGHCVPSRMKPARSVLARSGPARAYEASRAAPVTPGWTTGEKLSASMTADLATRTLAICVQPPAATACRCGPATFSIPVSSSRAWSAVYRTAGVEIVAGEAASWMRRTTLSWVRPSPLTDRPAGRSPTLRLAWSSTDRAGSASAPSAASTRRSSSPPLIPARSRLVPGSTCRPGDQPAVTTCRRSASGRRPGVERATTAAGALELTSSSAATAPTPTAATG